MDVLFSTHASAITGFGHATRCARLSGLIKRRNQAVRTAFTGDFSATAAEWLRTFAQIDEFVTDAISAKVGVYDRMDDSEKPEIVDERRLRELQLRCSTVFLMANGLHAPRESGNSIVIGYKSDNVLSNPPHLYWGLDFAPVGSDTLPQHAVRDPRRVFVALGGARGSDGLRKVLNAIASIAEISIVEVLDSPVNPLDPESAWLRADQILTVHRGVTSVTPFLAAAGLVVASYGHLGYEALACGAPLCLVGQKLFQAEYANELARRGLCMSGNLLATASLADLSAVFKSTLAAASQLSVAASKAVDGRGLDRIADLIVQRVEQAA